MMRCLNVFPLISMYVFVTNKHDPIIHYSPEILTHFMYGREDKTVD